MDIEPKVGSIISIAIEPKGFILKKHRGPKARSCVRSQAKGNTEGRRPDRVLEIRERSRLELGLGLGLDLNKIITPGNWCGTVWLSGYVQCVTSGKPGFESQLKHLFCNIFFHFFRISLSSQI